MKVRPASGMDIDEAMSRIIEINSHGELMDYLTKEVYYWHPTNENVTIEPYGFDNRINWDTYLICVDGKAVLFSDGPLANIKDK